MEGMAKSSGPNTPISSVEPATVTANPLSKAHYWAGVPLDVYNYFTLNMKDMHDVDLEQLQYVFDTVQKKTEDPTMGNVLLALKSIEQMLGVPQLGEARYKRVYNYVKLLSTIEDLNKKRQAMEW